MTKEPVLKRKVKYHWPPYTNFVQISCFFYSIFHIKTSYLNEEVNCTNPSPSISIPCIVLRLSVSVRDFPFNCWRLCPNLHEVCLRGCQICGLWPRPGAKCYKPFYSHKLKFYCNKLERLSLRSHSSPVWCLRVRPESTWVKLLSGLHTLGCSWPYPQT